MGIHVSEIQRKCNLGYDKAKELQTNLIKLGIINEEFMLLDSNPSEQVMPKIAEIIKQIKEWEQIAVKTNSEAGCSMAMAYKFCYELLEEKFAEDKSGLACYNTQCKSFDGLTPKNEDEIGISGDFFGENLIQTLVERLDKKGIRCHDSAIVNELRTLNFKVK